MWINYNFRFCSWLNKVCTLDYPWLSIIHGNPSAILPRIIESTLYNILIFFSPHKRILYLYQAIGKHNVFLILWRSPKVAVDYAADPKPRSGKWQTEGFRVFRRNFWRSWGGILKQPLLFPSTPFRCHGYRLSRPLCS
jgi:hypothetical protein